MEDGILCDYNNLSNTADGAESLQAVDDDAAFFDDLGFDGQTGNKEARRSAFMLMTLKSNGNESPLLDTIVQAAIAIFRGGQR